MYFFFCFCLLSFVLQEQISITWILLLDKAYAVKDFRSQGHALIDMMADYLAEATSDQKEVQAIPWQNPGKQLDYWQRDFQKPDLADPLELFKDVMDRSYRCTASGTWGIKPHLPYLLLYSPAPLQPF